MLRFSREDTWCGRCQILQIFSVLWKAMLIKLIALWNFLSPCGQSVSHRSHAVHSAERMDILRNVSVWAGTITVPVIFKSTVTRNSNDSPQSSKIKNFKDQGSSQVSRCSRLFKNLSIPFENLSSQVSRLSSGKNKGLFTRHVWILRKAYFGFLYRQIYFEFRYMISRWICWSENLLRGFSFFNLFYRNLSWMSFTK